MAPRRSAQKRRASDPCQIRQAASEEPLGAGPQPSSVRRERGTEGDNDENHACKRQRRHNDAHNETIGRHNNAAETVAPALADPLTDVSNFASSMSSNDDYGFVSDHPCRTEQAFDSRYIQSGAGMNIAGQPRTQDLAAIAGSSQGLGEGTMNNMNAILDVPPGLLGFPHGDLSYSPYLGVDQELQAPLSGQILFAGSYNATGAEVGDLDWSTNPAPAPLAFTQEYGQAGMAFDPLQSLVPLPDAAPGAPYAGSSGGDLAFAGTNFDDGLPFAGYDAWASQPNLDPQTFFGQGLASNPIEGDWDSMAAPPDGLFDAGEDGHKSVHDGSFDPSMLAAAYPHTAFGRHVQTDNTLVPQAQSQPSGSGARASEKKKETPSNATEHSGDTGDESGQTTWGGAFECDDCGAQFAKRPALRNHRMRLHNPFIINFGKKYACILCTENVSTACEHYHRHRTGKGIPQCSVMKRLDGDYTALMRSLVAAELAKGVDGKGLECLAHWQFGGKGTQCFKGLCKAWDEERTAKGELWQAMRAHGDRIPVMDLIDGQGDGEYPMKWAPTGEFYEPGMEPGVANKGQKDAEKGKTKAGKGKRKVKKEIV
ncbi:hypothetical protein AURDEDRAFT_169340 [Auricularia subglabra TFB-10046 SS5]|nr:hypothetical protein AURDEDRAFT_169340 [Auricularia subglabra TFB-10046 SS5]